MSTMSTISTVLKGFVEWIKNQNLKLKKFEVIHYEKQVKRLRRAVDYAEKYILESETKARPNILAKWRRYFFKYNS